MTTATPSPLTVFRSSRDIFLNSVVSGVSGLESAVLEFERDHARRTAAAESEAARLRGENADLLAELGEKEEALQEARAGVPVLAIPAVHEEPAELVEARETIRGLQAQLDERPAPAADEDSDGDSVALATAEAAAERMRLELEGAGATIATQARTLQEEARLREQLAEEARSRREEYDRNLAELRDEIAGLEEAAREADRTMESRMEAARIAARAEALNIVKAVATDSPDTPLDEAVDLVVIAMDVPAPADEEPAGEPIEAPELDEALEAAEFPVTDPDAGGPGLEIPAIDTDAEPVPLPFEPDDSFFAKLAPPVVQEESSIFGAAPEEDDEPDLAQDDDAGLKPQLMFDIDAPLEAEPAKEPEVPKPGFGLFRKGSQAA